MIVRTRLYVFLTLVCLLAVWPLDASAQSDKLLLLATTTSTRDSGLLDVLVPVFEKQSGYQVKTIAVGTGKALEMGKRGDADILITHAPAAEKPLVEQGWLVERVPFMHNDFVVVGPETDPAQLRTATSATDALQRIVAAKALFISRGDNSGTHKREQSLWREVNSKPDATWYLESGQGMGATLRIASEKQAYALTDRSTYLHLQPTLQSVILYAGDPSLRNIYSVMLVNPAKHERLNAKGAKAFHAWLLSEDARARIREYGVARFGQALFILDPLP